MNNRRSTLPVAAALLGALLTACDGDSNASAAADDVLDLTATEAVRIGSVDDPEYAFPRPTIMAVADDGRIVTGHPQGPEIRVFGPDGTTLGVIGQPGEGPGEYQSLGAISIEGDSVWVLDRATYRFIAYDLDSGDALRTVSIPVGESTFDDRIVRPSQRLGPGLYLGQPSTPSHLVSAGEITTFAPLLLDSQGVQIDTLPPIPIGNNSWAIEPEPGQGGMYTRQPFGDGPLFGVRPDGSFLLLDRAVPADGVYRPLRLSRLTPDGDTVWSREIDFEVRPIAAGVADSIVDAVIPADGFGRPRGPLIEAGRRSLYLPPYRPGASTLVVDADGRSWVRAGATDDGQVTWWIVGPDGDMIGRVRFPDDYNLMDARGSRVWGVQLGEFDVPYIVGFDVELP